MRTRALPHGRWMDDDGDWITLSTEEELTEALHVCGRKLRLDVTVSTPKTPAPSSPEVRTLPISPQHGMRYQAFLSSRLSPWAWRWRRPMESELSTMYILPRLRVLRRPHIVCVCSAWRRSLKLPRPPSSRMNHSRRHVQASTLTTEGRRTRGGGVARGRARRCKSCARRSRR